MSDKEKDEILDEPEPQMEESVDSETLEEETVQQETTQEATADETGEKQEVDPRDAEIVVLNNRLLRLQADFDNYRRRAKQEKEQLATYVTAEVIGKFLKILDNFERAEASATQDVDAESIRKGLEQIRKQFDEALKALEVEEIPAAGEKFNPNLHEAVMRGQNPEMEDESIDLVLEKGYKLHEKVIRHSKVRVIANG